MSRVHRAMRWGGVVALVWPISLVDVEEAQACSCTLFSRQGPESGQSGVPLNVQIQGFYLPEGQSLRLIGPDGDVPLAQSFLTRDDDDGYRPQAYPLYTPTELLRPNSEYFLEPHPWQGGPHNFRTGDELLDAPFPPVVNRMSRNTGGDEDLNCYEGQRLIIEGFGDGRVLYYAQANVQPPPDPTTDPVSWFGDSHGVVVGGKGCSERWNRGGAHAVYSVSMNEAGLFSEPTLLPGAFDLSENPTSQALALLPVSGVDEAVRSLTEKEIRDSRGCQISSPGASAPWGWMWGAVLWILLGAARVASRPGRLG